MDPFLALSAAATVQADQAQCCTIWLAVLRQAAQFDSSARFFTFF
jgi:hypothetical protein